MRCIGRIDESGSFKTFGPGPLADAVSVDGLSGVSFFARSGRADVWADLSRHSDFSVGLGGGLCAGGDCFDPGDPEDALAGGFEERSDFYGDAGVESAAESGDFGAGGAEDGDFYW